MIRLRPLALSAALMAAPLPAQSELRAVLVGVSDYLTLDADLKGPGNDVRLMAEVLTGRGIAAREMTVLTSDASGLPAGVALGPPTKAAIMAALGDVAARALPGDTVLFYFSGHGGQAPDQSGDEGGGFDEIFLPADAAGWNGATGAVENAILDDELQAWAQALLTRGVKLVGLIDACHADTGFRGSPAGVARGLSMQDLAIPEATNAGGGAPILQLQGDFVFLYSSQSDQRSFEYPLGDSGLWQGEFTLRLAEVLRSAPDAAWSQVLAATSAAMVQGAAAQSPAGEGPLLAASVFGSPAPERFAVQAGVLQAGLLQGLQPGDRLGLFADPAGGAVLAEVTLANIGARSTALPADLPPAAWAEVLAPALPKPLRLGAAQRFDEGDGFDYTDWRAALPPAEPQPDLLPILVQGGLAFAAPGTAPELAPRVTLQDGEDKAAAVARVLEQANHAQRLRQMFATLAGRSLTGKPALTLDWQRKAAPGCGLSGPAEAVDPAAGVQPCDQLWASFKNTAGRDLDVSLLYFNADFSITPLWPRQGLSNRLAPGETGKAGLRIDPGSVAAVEDLLVLAVPVKSGAARIDLTGLAEPSPTRAGNWFSAQLNSDATRGFSTKPPALIMLRQQVRVLPAQQGG